MLNIFTIKLWSNANYPIELDPVNYCHGFSSVHYREHQYLKGMTSLKSLQLIQWHLQEPRWFERSLYLVGQSLHWEPDIRNRPIFQPYTAVSVRGDMLHG